MSDAIAAEFAGAHGRTATDTDNEPSDALDLFNIPEQEDAYKSGRVVQHRPLNELASGGPVEFAIPGDSEEYLQLSSARLYGTMRVVNAKPGGVMAKLDEDDVVATTNLMPYSLFRAIEIEVNGRPVTSLTTELAHYKAHIEHLLSYGEDARKTQMQASLWTPDTPGTMDDVNHDGKNAGFTKRAATISESKKIQFYIPLQNDFINVQRLIPNNVNVKIKMIRAPDDFTLLSPLADARYKVELLDVRLYIRKVLLKDAIVARHRSLFAKGNAVLPFTRTVLRHRNVKPGDNRVDLGNIFNGKLPTHLILGMVSSTAFNGSYRLNPYNFQHFGLNYCQLKVADRPVPSAPYTPNFAEGLYAREYRSLFDESGILATNAGHSVTPEAFVGGNFFLSFDLSPDGCNRCVLLLLLLLLRIRIRYTYVV
jgi:ribonucleoside-diphosphate reductase beta chain